MKKKRVFRGGGNLALVTLEAYIFPDVLRKFEEACKKQGVNQGQFLTSHLLAMIHCVAEEPEQDLLKHFKEQMELCEVVSSGFCSSGDKAM